MTIEESYIRSFVAAVASAAAVAFFVVFVGVRWRSRIGPGAMRVVGGIAMVSAWVVAHQMMRGAVPMWSWSMETIGRAVWPPDVTRRLPMVAVASVVAGVVADRTGGVLRRCVVAALVGAIGMLLAEVAWRTGGLRMWMVRGAVVVVCGWMVWWWVLGVASRGGSGLVVASGAMLGVCGVGVVLCVAGAYSLGMVLVCGMIPMVVVCVGAAWARELLTGVVFSVVVTGVVMAGVVGGVVAGSPAALAGLPLVVGSILVAGGRGAGRGPGTGFFGGPVVRFGVGAAVALAGVVVAWAVR